MKLHELLKVNDKQVKLSDKIIRLEYQAVGSASFTFVSDVPPQKGQSIEYQAAMGSGDKHVIFSGYIDQVIHKQQNVYQAKCREWSGLLHQTMSLSLRHVNAQQIFTKLSELTGLTFLLPSSDWVNTVLPRFMHVGTAQTCLVALFDAFDISSPCWMLQSDLKIYVGESDKSVSGSKTIALPVQNLSDVNFQGASVIFIPRLRPGTNIEFHDRVYVINTVDITGVQMRLNWIKQHEVRGAA